MSIWRWEAGTIMRTWREKKKSKQTEEHIYTPESCGCLFLHLVLLHLGSLLQAFDLCLVVGNQFFSVCQFAVLLVNQTVDGKEVGVQLLQHGLHGVGWIQQDKTKTRGVGVKNQFDIQCGKSDAELEREQAPALLYSSSIICLTLCLFCRASISLGRVTSSWASVSSEEGKGGRLCTRWFIADGTSTERNFNKYHCWPTTMSWFLILAPLCI